MKVCKLFLIFLKEKSSGWWVLGAPNTAIYLIYRSKFISVTVARWHFSRQISLCCSLKNTTLYMCDSGLQWNMLNFPSFHWFRILLPDVHELAELKVHTHEKSHLVKTGGEKYVTPSSIKYKCNKQTLERFVHNEAEWMHSSQVLFMRA